MRGWQLLLMDGMMQYGYIASTLPFWNFASEEVFPTEEFSYERKSACW
jgi:hypothetical protein